MRQVPELFVIYGLGYATVFFIFVVLYWRALRKREQLDLSRFEVFETYTNMLESGCFCATGVLCATTAVVLPLNLAGMAGYVFFLIPFGMFTIASLREKSRRKLEVENSAKAESTS